MKRFAVLILTVSAALCGCKPSDQNTLSLGTTNDLASPSLKDKAIAEMSAKMSQLETECSELSAKVKIGSETVRAEAGPKLQALRDKISDLDQTRVMLRRELPQ